MIHLLGIEPCEHIEAFVANQSVGADHRQLRHVDLDVAESVLLEIDRSTDAL